MENFIPELVEKLKAAGLPLAEDNLLIIYDVISNHLKSFDYPNDIVKALVPAVMLVADPLVKEQIEKIDMSDNPLPPAA